MKNRRLLTAFLLFGMALLSTLFALQGILSPLDAGLDSFSVFA